MITSGLRIGSPGSPRAASRSGNRAGGGSHRRRARCRRRRRPSIERVRAAGGRAVPALPGVRADRARARRQPHVLPFCGHDETKVIDSRLAARGGRSAAAASAWRAASASRPSRQRSCVMPLVVKGDRSREAFDEAKLRAGMEKALEKRPVSREADRRSGRAASCHKVRSARRARGAAARRRRDRDGGAAAARRGGVRALRLGVPAASRTSRPSTRRSSACAASAPGPRRAVAAQARAARAASSCRCCRGRFDSDGRRSVAAARTDPPAACTAPRGVIYLCVNLDGNDVSDFDRFAMARALELAARGLDTTAPESARRLRDRAATAASSAKAGTSAPARRTRKCAALRAAGEQAARRHRLRDARALQPPRPHAAVRRRASRGARGARGVRHRGPQSAGQRAAARRRCARPASRSTRA